MSSTTTTNYRAADDGWLSRERALALALIVTTVIVFYLCYRLILPFLPALAWALALAVMAHPLNRRIQAWIPYRTIASAVSVVLVIIVIVIPVIFVTQNLVREGSRYMELAQKEFASGKWRETLNKNQRLKPLVHWIDNEVNEKLGSGDSSRDSESEKSQSGERGSTSERKTTSRSDGSSDAAAGGSLATNDPPNKQPKSTKSDPASESNVSNQQDHQGPAELTHSEPIIPAGVAQVERTASALTQGVGTVVSGTIWFVMQLFITILCLFFFFRAQQASLWVYPEAERHRKY